jgi:hypothetical protein
MNYFRMFWRRQFKRAVEEHPDRWAHHEAGAADGNVVPRKNQNEAHPFAAR